MIKLICIMPIIMMIGTIGFALADDESQVNNGTMDLVTIISGYTYSMDQSVEGMGFADINNHMDVVNTDPTSSRYGTHILALKYEGSGSGSYNHESTNDVISHAYVSNSGDFSSSNYKIDSNTNTKAVYSPVAFQFPGSFKIDSFKSTWKEKTFSNNTAGIISMDSLFNYAKSLKTETHTTLTSDVYTYPDYMGATNSTIGSHMDVNAAFEGAGHIGATINDVRGGRWGGRYDFKAKPNDTVLIDEDYNGIFNITKKMAVDISKTTDYGDYDTNFDGYTEDYPWLPCLCNLGWDGMAIHDTRFHSAKGFFDCTECKPPAPCKN